MIALTDRIPTSWLAAALAALVSVLVPLSIWTAIYFPISTYEMWHSVSWESETSLRVKHGFYEYNGRWPSEKIREYLLDTETGDFDFIESRVERGGLQLGQTSLYSPIPGCQNKLLKLPAYDAADWLEELGYRALESPTLPEDTSIVILLDADEQELGRWIVNDDQELEPVNLRFPIEQHLRNGNRAVTIVDALTGDEIGRYIAPVSKYGIVQWRLYGDVFEFSDDLQTLAVYELKTGRELNVNGAWEGQVVGIFEDEFLTVEDQWYWGYPANWPPTMQVRSLLTGEVLRSFAFPQHCALSTPVGSEIRFSEDGQQIIFASWRDEVFFVDKWTGEIDRVVAPRKWHFAIGILCGALAFACCLLWFQLCRRWGISQLHRGLVLSIPLFAFLAMRIGFSGHHARYERFAWCAVEGLLIVWMLAISVLLASKQVPFWQRNRRLACFALLIWWFVASGVMNWWQQSEFLAVLAAVLLAAILVPYLADVQGSRRGRVVRSVSVERKSFSISMWGLFEFLTLAACLVAVIMNTAPNVWKYLTLGRIGEPLLHAIGSIGATCFFVWLVNRRQRSGAFRVFSVVFVGAAFGFSQVAWPFYWKGVPWYDHWDTAQSVVPAMTISVFAALGFWPSTSPHRFSAQADS